MYVYACVNHLRKFNITFNSDIVDLTNVNIDKLYSSIIKHRKDYIDANLIDKRYYNNTNISNKDKLKSITNLLSNFGYHRIKTKDNNIQYKINDNIIDYYNLKNDKMNDNSDIDEMILKIPYDDRTINLINKVNNSVK